MQEVIFWTWDITSHTINVFEEINKTSKVKVFFTKYDTRKLGCLPLKDLEIVHIQSKSEVDAIIAQTKDAVHINNALKVFNDEGIQLLNYALRKLLKRKYFCIALFQEQYYWWGWKGGLRRLKWGWIFNFGYARHLKAIGCTGWTGMEAHRKALVPNHKLFDFIYTVPTFDSNRLMAGNSNLKEEKVRFVFVGQLIDRKSIIELIDIFNSIEADYELNIIGEGILRNHILSKIKENGKIHLLGKLMPADVRNILSNSDALILPSKSEGWGCVVNEALMSGCRVIVSSVVGARALIDKKETRGEIFINNGWSDLRRCIIKSIQRGILSASERQGIALWAKCISPQSEACYFEEIVNYYQGKRAGKPKAPWSNL